ncbi:PD-(D/E)XK nuclease family protein [Demequina sp. NBRC 110055]|uniref:RecB family exonuclease n=1 Tax=Demequina sp. NBRC 110055 TaxID=1570344 RepID=UPI000A00C617|nr:PD-(D/E)XK nuclease family protein [Demequina sp. NBRC 110055]
MARRSPALSPSRAGDFRQCPHLYRLRVVDKIPEPPSAAATLGTLVHAVLEHLYDKPAVERTEATASAMLEPQWRAMVERDPALGALHEDSHAEATWLAEGRGRLATYFTMENPQRLEPDGREEFVELQLPDGPLLRGFIDRVDVAPDGSIRIIDYKTGKTPLPQYGHKEKFQMRFYALLVERLRGRRPALLQLLFLKDGGTLVLRPSDDDLAQIEFEVRELWDEILGAARTGAFRPKKSKLCGWCSFQSLCPEFGGEAPALDPDAVERALGVRPVSA